MASGGRFINGVGLLEIKIIVGVRRLVRVYAAGPEIVDRKTGDLATIAIGISTFPLSVHGPSFDRCPCERPGLVERLGRKYQLFLARLVPLSLRCR